MSTILRGVNVAMCTPFTEGDQLLDAGRLREHIDMLIDAGVHGIVANAGTGEFAYMDDDEAARIAAVSIDHIAGRVPVTVQTSAVSLRHCIEKSQRAIDSGADALMVLPPYLEGPFARGVMHHYVALADAVDTTLVLYNIPEISGVAITPTMWAELSAHTNIGHIKDSTGDLSGLQNLILADSQTPSGVMGGADPVAPFAAMAGVCGWIWGAANVMPHLCVKLWDLLEAEQHAEALDLWTTTMFAFNSWIWANPQDAEYITAVKSATSHRWGAVGPSRLPQLPLTDEAREAMVQALIPLVSD